MNPVIPVFISSPQDVREERQLTEQAVNELAPRLARLFGVGLVPLRWDKFAPIATFDASHPQAGIQQLIVPFSIFVMILGSRYGTGIAPDLLSGTEHEVNRALSSRDQIAILSYVREPPAAPPVGEEKAQHRRLAAFKKRLTEKNVLWLPYGGPRHFQQRILGDLMEAALKLILAGSPRMVADYLKIFRFGSHGRAGRLPILIVYPPMTDPGPGHEAPRFAWQDRLLPHIIYEDFKAIQDVEQAMRLLRREYKTVTTDSPTYDTAEPGDRVWVCVPRNRQAKDVLVELGSRVRFRFEPRGDEGRQELMLEWRRPSDAEPFWISSPLKKYLSHSIRPPAAAPWTPLYGYAYGRDYAVFARFRVPRHSQANDGVLFYHYFVGGIRGLGTWGVGHLIDHESASLLAWIERSVRDPAEDDFQLLLEVTYENFRIREVRNVSDEPESYFTTRSSDEYIAGQLANRTEWRPR